MKKAFNYMFLDSKYYKKAAIFLIYIILLLYCSIFSLTGCNDTISLKIFNYIIITSIVLFGYSIVEGYKIAVMKSINIGNENIQVLPMLNMKKDFVIGIKYLISLLIFSIPFFCIIGTFGFAIGFAPMLNMPNEIIYTSGILFIISILAYIIYLICFLPASIAIFSETNSIWSFYMFEEVFNLVFANKKEYAKSAFLYFILGIIIEECYRICLITSKKSMILLFIVIFVLACIISYVCFVMSYVIAKINEKNM